MCCDKNGVANSMGVVMFVLFAFFMFGGIGVGLYMTGCDPHGYCRGGIVKATSIGKYYTTQNTCSYCSRECTSSDTSTGCCEYTNYFCYDSYALFHYDKGNCTMHVDTENADQNNALAHAASKYPAGKHMKVQNVKPSGDQNGCTTMATAVAQSYAGIVFMCFGACIILIALTISCRNLCKQMGNPAVRTSPSYGLEMVNSDIKTTEGGSGQPQSYPYSTYVSAPETDGPPGQTLAVSYGPPGSALTYAAVSTEGAVGDDKQVR